jgi:hypothetical protein
MLKKALLVLAVAAAGLAAWLYHIDFWAIDQCLDAGGCWRYGARQCEMVSQELCDQENPFR